MKLELYGLRQLQSISPLQGMKESVTEFVIERCMHVKDLENIGCYKSLEKLILIHVGIVPTLYFIAHLEKLTHFVFVEIELADSDVAPLLGINFVQFDEKEWYSHSLKEIKRLNGAAKRKRNFRGDGY